ncbi:MAG: glycosyltransferase family 2 protein [Candidatus Tectimicrobiota bacterium]
MTQPTIYCSVVIRVRNQARHLHQVLQALAAQRCSFPWEIIIVDNESDDETLALCEQYQARVVSISRAEFTYGKALNLGIRQARGELVFLCSAHAIPIGSYFLEAAVAPFTDPQVAAARCLSGSYKEQTALWYAARDIHYPSYEEQQAAEAGSKWLTDYPSASCCIIRRAVWEQIPYNEELEAMEDKLWAREVLKKGFKIRSCAEAVFIYNRQRTRGAAWKKLNREHRALYRVLGQVPLPWGRFFFTLGRAILLAPLAGVRYIVEIVAPGLYLVSIPLQVRFGQRGTGSISEYNRHNPR